jgi:hypothetical protein
MDLSSMFSQVIPTMIFAWIFVMLFILSMLQTIKRFRRLIHRIKVISNPDYRTKVILDSNFEELSWTSRLIMSLRNRWINFVESFRLNILAGPNNIRLAIQSAWIGS